MKKFLSKPNLGGQLTILNCVCWALLILWINFGSVPHDRNLAIVYVIPLLILSFPLATICMMPNVSGGPSLEEGIASIFMISLNSIVWGYSLAWILTKLGLCSSQEETTVPTDDKSTNGSN